MFDQPNTVTRFFRRIFKIAPPTKTVRDQTRRFKAARGVGAFGGLSIISPRAEVREGLRGLINTARNAAQNIDHIKSYEMMVRRHVIGPDGIRLRPDAITAAGAPDAGANAALAALWKEWGRKGNCTPCGRLSFWQIEKLAATALAREGNFFLRGWSGPAFGKFGFQIQPLSIDLLDLDMVQSTKGGGYIDGGVEFSALGRPLAYHFFDGHPAESHTGGNRRRLRIPADQIIHVQRHTTVAQALGLPESHTAIRRFNMLDQYEQAALQAAHYAAAQMVFFEQDLDGVAPSAVGGDAEALPVEIEPGQTAMLPPGVKVNANPVRAPDPNMPDFIKAMSRGAAAGLGVSYAGLSSDMEGANFSSLKDGRGEERDEWRIFQRDLIEDLHSPVFSRLLSRAILTPALDLPADQLARFDRPEWRPRAWAAVNPKDDAIADRMDIETGLKSRTEVAAKRGRDITEIAAELKEEKELFGDDLKPAAPVAPPDSPKKDIEE